MPTPKLRLAALACFALCARAEVSLPALLADHMVLQRGLPIHVWGKAAPGEAVSVAFRGDTRATAADADGLWSVYLPPAEAGGPFELTVNSITLHDVLVGDIWVASGQSNMEFALKSADNAPAEIAAGNHPRIRLFQVKNKAAAAPLDDVDARPWTPATPETAAGFSAVAWFFGRHLEDKLGVPIGLIQTAWGGTPAEAWTSLRALSADASLMPVFAAWDRQSKETAAARPRREKQLKDWQDAAARAKAEAKEPPPFPWARNDSGEWAPAALYNAMLAPLTRFPIRGVIWYQGESNASAERAPLYARLFSTLIQDWRRSWGQGDFPFLFVQLANFKTGGPWPELRDAQRETLSLANTGMAVAIDIGNPTDIHPRNKQDVGLRLALAARALAYGEKIEYSGPLFRQATPEPHALRLWFEHAAGLASKGPLKGFEIAAAGGRFFPAEARIDGATLVVSSPAVAAPSYARYAWSDNPDCTLYNSDGLPASPFSSGFVAPLPTAPAGALTARALIERIRQNLGVPWRADTVDTFKTGNPDAQVTGIATTFTATLDVLRRAAASGKNLIITHEPTFYNHFDSIADYQNDPVYRAKRAFIDQHDLIIFRFHDHWHARRPDGIIEGVSRALGWQGKDGFFVLPETTLGKLAAEVRTRLRIRTLRVVGDPQMKLTRAALSPGAYGSLDRIHLLERDDVEALLIGESPEWETIEYVRDAVAAGHHKALLILGHVVSEEPGMDECARWLRTFIPEVPIDFLPAAEPYW